MAIDSNATRDVSVTLSEKSMQEFDCISALVSTVGLYKANDGMVPTKFGDSY